MIEVEFLLVERGEVGADGAEGGGAVESAEATGELLFDFAHTDRLFGDVIGERGIEVERKAEHIVLVQAQARQQIRCVALPCSAAPAGRRSRWIEHLACREDSGATQSCDVGSDEPPAP